MNILYQVHNQRNKLGQNKKEQTTKVTIEKRENTFLDDHSL